MENQQGGGGPLGRWNAGKQAKRRLTRVLRKAGGVPLIIGLRDRNGGIRVIVGASPSPRASSAAANPLVPARELLRGVAVDHMQPEGFGPLTGEGTQTAQVAEEDAELVHRRRCPEPGSSVCRLLGGKPERLGPGSACCFVRKPGTPAGGPPRHLALSGHVSLRPEERTLPRTARNKLLHPGYDDGGEDEDVFGESVAHTPVAYGPTSNNRDDLAVVELANTVRPRMESTYDPACLYRTVAVFEVTAGAGAPGWQMDAGRWAAWRQAGFQARWLEATFAGARARAALSPAGPPPVGELFLDAEVYKGKTVLRIRERVGRVVGTAAQTRATLKQTVCKLGRTTGYTEGVFETIRSDVLNFPYGGPGPDRSAHFRQVMVIRGNDKRSFAECGDSGGPVFLRDGDEVRILGYVFGVTTLADGIRRALVLPLRPALDALGYELFTG